MALFGRHLKYITLSVLKEISNMVTGSIVSRRWEARVYPSGMQGLSVCPMGSAPCSNTRLSIYPGGANGPIERERQNTRNKHYNVIIHCDKFSKGNCVVKENSLEPRRNLDRRETRPF